MTAGQELPRSASTRSLDGVHIRRWIASIGLPVAILFLLGLSVARTYSLGEHRSMYDNPIYRWRESLAIALSRMQAKPLHGYLAYGSISNYLNQHGLAIFGSEARPVPTDEERSALIHDGARMEKLIGEARQVPIDPSLPPVTLHGNEKGLADYYYFAFELFGLNMNALVMFYYLLLAASVVMFVAVFRGSPFCMLLLALYLITHYFMVGYASAPYFQTIHNSRFFPVLAMLPAMHLLLLVLRREPPTPGNLAAAIGQAGLLCFLVFCRQQAIWQAVAVMASPLLVLQLTDYMALMRAVRQPREAGSAIEALLPGTWPALLTVVGLVGLLLYSHLALALAYRTDTATHPFWDSVLGGTISANPELYRLYGNNDPLYGDTIVFDAIQTDLRERHDTTPDIVSVQNGVIYIDPFLDEAVYDKLAWHVFRKIAAAHPWLTLKSFIYDKPYNQINMLVDQPFPYPGGYKIAFILAVGMVLLNLASGHQHWQSSYVKITIRAILLLAMLSSTTTLVTPSMLIADTWSFYIMLSFLVGIYLPAMGLLAIWSIAKKKRNGVFLQT